MLGLCSSAALAGGSKDRIALFQYRTIFHSGLKQNHVVALTFDDGPNANTGAVLDALKAYNIKATFFVVGRMARAHPEMLRRIAAEGHLLANHSATHPMLGHAFDEHPERLLDQLRDVNDQIAPLMRQGDKFYFRAPYGSWRSAHADILNADPVLRNYVGPIYWDIGGDISRGADGYIMSSADWDCWHHRWVSARDPPQEWRRGADALHLVAIGRAGRRRRAGAGARGLQLRAPRPGAGIQAVRHAAAFQRGRERGHVERAADGGAEIADGRALRRGRCRFRE
jgi:peptidoglycan/xylan/chitin deacetylase (PgdA/CDA1 family)